jgi:mannosyltransferase OCH1-like enzyme
MHYKVISRSGAKTAWPGFVPRFICQTCLRLRYVEKRQDFARIFILYSEKTGVWFDF